MTTFYWILLNIIVIIFLNKIQDCIENIRKIYRKKVNICQNLDGIRNKPLMFKDFKVLIIFFYLKSSIF